MSTEIQVTMTRDEKGKAKGLEFKTFRLKTTTDTHGNEERLLEFHTDKLRSFLRDNISLEDIYDDVPVIPVYTLFNQLDQIKHRAKRYDMLSVVKELVAFLEEENKDILGRIKNMLDRGQMSFGLCKTLFAEGTEIEIHGDEIMGGRVVGTEYRASMFGTYLQIAYEYVSTNGRSFIQRRDQVRIGAFNGVKEISKLPIRPMTDETKARLTERGKMFAQVALGAHYMQYQGMMGVKKWWSWDNMRAEGRMMTDPGTYAQFVDEYDRDEDHDIDELRDDAMWMTDPYVKGFSFVTKQWGRFSVGNISPIAYRDDAFDQLVLAEDKKELVRALVTNGGGGFQDIISGKGGGCIFLLHGDPGVGKTLTAEAIAELLHRPLYSVAVGELGTNTEQLEKSLRQILDVAQIWNAMVLIDEADIFLEKRTSGDILRNAMVGIFLRLLEYHQGVLFLTTNRVTEFDSAFHSRISVALKYGALTREAREKIWTNLLAAARIDGLDPAELSLTEINGRQIKNTIRLAQGLAAQQDVPVSAKHIEMTLSVSQQFQRDLKEG
jgi:hypothetical protein